METDWEATFKSRDTSFQLLPPNYARLFFAFLATRLCVALLICFCHLILCICFTSPSCERYFRLFILFILFLVNGSLQKAVKGPTGKRVNQNHVLPCNYILINMSHKHVPTPVLGMEAICQFQQCSEFMFISIDIEKSV